MDTCASAASESNTASAIIVLKSSSFKAFEGDSNDLKAATTTHTHTHTHTHTQLKKIKKANLKKKAKYCSMRL